MKRDPTSDTAKALLCLFSATVVLALIHLVSSHINNMFRTKYDKSEENSIICVGFKHFYDILIY